MYFTDFTGLAGLSIFISLIILRNNIFSKLSQKRKVLPLMAVMLFSFVPINGLSVTESLRGITGDLSIPTLLLLTVALSKILFPSRLTLAENKQRPLLLLVLVTGIIFYPLTLGLSNFDPYRLGFGHLGFVAVLLLLTILAWWQRAHLIALSVSLAVLAWSVGWYESNNLWDYLLDPWLFFFALMMVIRSAVAGLRRRFT